MKRNIKFRWIRFSIFSLFVILVMLASYKSNDFSLLNDENSKFFKNELFEPDLSIKLLDDNSKKIQEYSIKFNKEKLDHIQTDKIMMFLNKLTDNAYSVKLNGMIIGSEGDMENGRSVLKASPNYFVFDRKLLEDENQLVINTYAEYKSGLESEGVYFTDSKVGIRQAGTLNFFGSEILIFGIGFLAFSAIFMIFIYYLNKKKRIGVLYCAIATIFLQIYIMDYLKIDYLKYDYIIYKKIFLSALYIGYWFYALAMDKFFKCTYFKYSTGFTALSFIIMTFFVNDFILFKNLYQNWYILLLINILIGFIYSLLNVKKSEEALIFVLLFAAVFVFSGMSIFTETMYSSFRMNAPLIYIVNVSMLPILFGIGELTDKEEELYY